MSDADSPTSSSTSNNEMFGTIDTTTQFKGLIEDIKISKGVVYDPITVPTSNLTAVTGTVMLTGQTNHGTISDASSSNHTLTVNGNTVYSNYCPFINAVSFDSGTKGHVLHYRIGHGDTASNETDVHTSFNVETGNWTLEWWIKIDSTATDYDTIFGADGALALEFKNDNKIYMWLNSKAGGAGTWDLYNEQLLGSAVTNGKWTHMALTRDGEYFYFYQDGNRITSLAQSSSTEIKHWLDDTTVGINIMSYSNGSNNTAGSLSNFRFVKGSAVYSGATYTVPTSNLTAISGTQLLTCQSGHLMTDASTNNHVIRLGSSSSYVNHKPAPTYESPFSGSIYFDGTGDYITAAGHADFAFGSGDFTIEMFVRQTDKSAAEGFYQIGHSSAPFDADTTNVAAGWAGSAKYRVYGNGTGINSTTAMSPSDNDRWHHHIYMRKSGTSYVIIDGRVINKFSDSTNYTDNHFTLGGYYTTSYLITGYISNFRVVKGSAVYNPDFTALTTELA